MAQPGPFADAKHEMMESLRQRLWQFTLLALVILGQVLVLASEVGGWPFLVKLYGTLLTVLFLAIWFLAPYTRPLGHWLATGAFLAMTLLALIWFQADAMLCLLILPPTLATALVGGWYGLGLSALSTMFALFDIPLLGPHGTFSRTVTILLLWAIQGILLGVLQSVSQMVEWSWSSYADMRRLLEKARDQQVQLKQAQEDLVQANVELARVSERLASMRRIAEEARRVKEEFLANVSHELRTPLNMIIGFSEMITRAPDAYGEIPPKLLADVEVIQSNSRHLASLVDDVLDLSQVDAGRMALIKEWVSLGEVLAAAVAAVKPLFASKGLSLEWHMAEELTVYCDQTRIRQVIVNLLSNAGRFTERGGARVEARREGQDVLVSVADSGPGISVKDQERIFLPFEQATSGARRQGGSGLGLAISKRFVEMHGGRMWLESEVGKGSTFHFSLPVGEGQPLAGSWSRWFNPYSTYEPRTRPSMAPELRVPPRFVVLEPGNSLQRFIRRHWNGAEVVAVRDINQAAAELAKVPAQALIVSDQSLQEMPPRLGRLANLPYGTPVVACWLPDKQEAAERLGVVEYLVKPVSRDKLLAALDALGRPVHTVLIADDEVDALQLFARILTTAGRGYRVLRASTGQRALAQLREHHPDVLLLDLIMPEMDGYTLLRMKSKDASIRDVPVIAVSAQDPAHGPIASSALTIARSGGLYLQDLLRSMEAISSVLGPPDGSVDRERPEKSGG